MKTQDSAYLPDPILTTPGGQQPADLAAPQPADVIPDEVPRKDGPGGEGSARQADARKD